MDEKKYKIQLRYKSGKIVDFITKNPPVQNFLLPTNEGQKMFEVFLTLIKCGEDIEIQKVFYKEI